MQFSTMISTATGVAKIFKLINGLWQQLKPDVSISEAWHWADKYFGAPEDVAESMGCGCSAQELDRRQHSQTAGSFLLHLSMALDFASRAAVPENGGPKPCFQPSLLQATPLSKKFSPPPWFPAHCGPRALEISITAEPPKCCKTRGFCKHCHVSWAGWCFV